MILLRKKQADGSYFDFDKILVSGYKINEQPKLINKVQFTNTRRKKVVSAQNDVIISIDLGCFDGDTLAEYLKQLSDGEYQYYSLNDKKMKNINFITTLPEQVVDNCADTIIVGDFTAVLEKGSEII